MVIENADKICGSGLLCHMVAGNFFQLLPVILDVYKRQAGNQLLHLFAAADDGYAVVSDIGDDVSAVAANVKFHFTLPFSLSV